MTQEQLEKHRKLLSFKGVETEQDTQGAVVPTQVLMQFHKRKTLKLDKNLEWTDLHSEYNPDGSLNRLTFYKNGMVLYEMHFIWNANGTVSRIRRVNGGEQ